MRVFYGSRLSDNMTLTPEGYLICLNVPIARTGAQQYLKSELGLLDGDTNDVVDVMRTEAEVFAAATIASFEGKPVTDDHPPVSVTAENIVAYGNGHAQNIRRGTGEESDLLLADLIINAPKLIQEIQNGRREISCGYDCEYAQDDQGRLYQTSIRGNHVAVVSAGRAGHRVAIKDSEESNSKNSKNKERGKPKMAITKNNPSFVARLFSRAVKDMEPEEVAEAVDEIQQAAAATDETPASPTPAPTDCNTQQQAGDNDPMAKLLDAINGLGQKLDSILAANKPQDQEPEEKPADGDPLSALVAEIAENAAETPADQEASETIPADELPDDNSAQDEDGPVAAAELLSENPIPGADRAIAIAAINAIKPVIAALPEKQRKAAADKAATEIRKMIGVKPAANGYAGILGTMNQAAKRRAKDAKPKKMDDGAIGRSIMAARNPHYKKA